MPTHTPAVHGDNRREFMEKATALGAGAVAILAPVGIGLGAFLDPLGKAGGGEGLKVKITTLDALPDDGTPRKFAVIADRVDAWNKFFNEPIGNVFLRRVPGKPKEVVAYQVVCPHAGCAILYEAGDAGGKFFCPCHLASFDLDGRRTDAVSPSPRDMDTLTVEIGEQNEVFVVFQNFVVNKADKIALA